MGVGRVVLCCSYHPGHRIARPPLRFSDPQLSPLPSPPPRPCPPSAGSGNGPMATSNPINPAPAAAASFRTRSRAASATGPTPNLSSAVMRSVWSRDVLIETGVWGLGGREWAASDRSSGDHEPGEFTSRSVQQDLSEVPCEPPTHALQAIPEHLSKRFAIRLVTEY